MCVGVCVCKGMAWNSQAAFWKKYFYYRTKSRKVQRKDWGFQFLSVVQEAAYDNLGGRFIEITSYFTHDSFPAHAGWWIASSAIQAKARKLFAAKEKVLILKSYLVCSGVTLKCPKTGADFFFPNQENHFYSLQILWTAFSPLQNLIQLWLWNTKIIVAIWGW